MANGSPLSHAHRLTQSAILSAGSVRSWLPSFLDGLGVLQASIIADERFGVQVINFALADPTRVARLALLCSSRELVTSESYRRDAFHQTGQPLLLLESSGNPNLVGHIELSMLQQFLEEELVRG